MSSSALVFASVTAAFILVAISAAEPEIRSKCSFTQKDSTFSQFYPLADIPQSQPDGFYAKVTVSVTSDYGDVHILLAESADFENTNQGYEFVSALYHGSEIRRRNSVYGKYEVLTQVNSSVEDYAPGKTDFEVEVSTVVKVSVLSPNSTVVTYNPSFSLLDIAKYRVKCSNYSLETRDSNPFPIKFIAFPGHSKLQFNCDYGVFIDKAHFIQTRCKNIFGWRQEELFHPLNSIAEFQPAGYFAKVDISMLSDYGNMHVILSETSEKTGPNSSYEIVIADRFGTTSEFRRKNSISESYGFVNRSTFLYNVRKHRAAFFFFLIAEQDTRTQKEAI